MAQDTTLLGALGDERLRRRLQERIARASSHPWAVDVVVSHRFVELRGRVLTTEHDALLAAAYDVRGARGISDRLQLCTEEELEAEALETPTVLDVDRQTWKPATRLLVGAIGAALLAGLGDRAKLPGAAARIFGAWLLVEATTNRGLARLVGRGARRPPGLRPPGGRAPVVRVAPEDEATAGV
jgi:hypothetical protein